MQRDVGLEAERHDLTGVRRQAGEPPADVELQRPLAADGRAKIVGVVVGQVQRQHPAERRADEDRPVEFEHLGEAPDDGGGELLRERVLLGPPGLADRG